MICFPFIVTVVSRGKFVELCGLFVPSVNYKAEVTVNIERVRTNRLRNDLSVKTVYFMLSRSLFVTIETLMGRFNIDFVAFKTPYNDTIS